MLHFGDLIPSNTPWEIYYLYLDAPREYILLFSLIMTGSGGDSIPPSPTEDKQQRRSDTASYVYPVRSLLSGRFQQTGASDQSPRSPPSTSSAFDNDAGVAGPSATNTINLDSDEGDASTPMQGGTSTSLARRLSLDLGHGSSTVGLQKSNSSVGELSSMGMPNKPKKGTQ